MSLIRIRVSALLILVTLAALAMIACTGCGENFYDSMKPTTAGEHLGDTSSKVDLFWTLHQHGFNKAAISGCLPSRLYPDREDTLEEIEKINMVALALAKQTPEFIKALPLISPDDPDPVKKAKLYLIQAKAWGLALDPKPGQDLFSEKMFEVYKICELARAPIFLHFSKDRFGDLERLASDFPHMIFMVGHMAGQAGDLHKLDTLLYKHNNIYLSLGFGPEEVLFENMEALSKDIPLLKKFIEDHLERVCFASQTNLTEQPYRNSPFAESQVRFLRRFFEKDIARIKIKGRQGIWIEREYPGLELDKQSLGYIYRLNFMRAFAQTPHRADVYNLDLLVPGAPADGIFDPESEKRVIPAVVANTGTTITALSSGQLRKLISGAVKDFGSLSRGDGLIKLATCGPMADWVAMKLKVEPSKDIKRFDDPEKFTRYMETTKNAVGFCAFDQLSARFRTVKIDGESPAIPYVKFCAGKGAGTYGHYFNTYPILIPITTKKPGLVFDPHQFRQIILGGPATFGPFVAGKEKFVSAQHPTSSLAPEIRNAGITAFGFKGDIKENCDSLECTSTQYLSGILATGVDGYAGASSSLDSFFNPLVVSRIKPGAPMVKSVRGKLMAVIGGDCSIADLEILKKDVAALRKKGALVVAALGTTPEDFDKLAKALVNSGVQVVANIAEEKLQSWTVDENGIIAKGLGAPMVPKGRDNLAVFLIVTYYKDRLIAVEPLVVESANGKTRIGAGRTKEAIKILNSMAL